MQVLWNLHGQAQNLTKDVNGRALGQINGATLNAIMDLDNYGPGCFVLGPNVLEPYTHIDGLYRMIGPHKIETLRDTVNNRNHLSIDFGKAALFENNNNALEVISRPGFNATLIIDGTSTSSNITLNGGTTPSISVTSNVVLTGGATPSLYVGASSNIALIGGSNPALKIGASSNVLSSNAMAALYSLILAANPSFTP